MENWQECNIIILPIKEKPVIGQLYSFKDCLHKPNQLYIRTTKDSEIGNFYENTFSYNLYITNPKEEIKEGDWCLDKYNQIWKYSSGKLRSYDKLGIERFTTDNIEGQGVKKIIATTDESLKFGEDVPGFIKYKSLPKPSNEFLRKYCEVGGIDEVLVEYEYNHDDTVPFPKTVEGQEFKLKVAPDNTITIKPIKDSWNREEVVELFEKYIDAGKPILYPWIKENL